MDLTEHVVAAAGRATLTISGERQDLPHLLAEGVATVRPHAASGVAAVLRNDPASCALVLGAIATGSRLVSLPERPVATPPDRYADRFAPALARCGGPTLVGVEPAVAAALAGAGRGTVATTLGRPSGFELVQFTSGTTGVPRGVVVDADALLASSTAMMERMAVQAPPTVCSWLPLSHDMGLVGMYLTALLLASPGFVGHCDVELLQPTEFVRRPSRWLERLAAMGPVMTAAPDSALRHLLRTTEDVRLDLGALRAIIAGGEVNRPATIERLVRFLEANGSGGGAICAGYGMAEASLAVTLTPPGAGPSIVEVDVPGTDLRIPAVLAGAPVAGFAVAVDPESGRIRVDGPGLARNDLDGLPIAGPGGYLTSDLGHVAPDGSLAVLGRTDGTLVVNGRNLLAEDVDQAVAAADGVRSDRAVACMLLDGRWAVAAELRPGAAGAQAVLGELRRRATAVAGAAPDSVVAVRRGSIPFTTSGKLQRRRLGEELSSGTLEPTACLGSDPVVGAAAGEPA